METHPKCIFPLSSWRESFKFIGTLLDGVWYAKHSGRKLLEKFRVGQRFFPPLVSDSPIPKFEYYLFKNHFWELGSHKPKDHAKLINLFFNFFFYLPSISEPCKVCMFKLFFASSKQERAHVLKTESRACPLKNVSPGTSLKMIEIIV